MIIVIVMLLVGPVLLFVGGALWSAFIGGALVNDRQAVARPGQAEG